MIEDADIDKSPGFKMDQDIFRENVKSLKMAVSTKKKEMKDAGFILPETKPVFVEVKIVAICFVEPSGT